MTSGSKAPRTSLDIAQISSGLVLIALGGIGMFGGLQLRLGSLQSPGPGMMPLVIGGALVAVGVLVCILFGRKPPAAEVTDVPDGPVVLPTWLAAAMLALFAMLIPLAGFYTASFAFIGAALVASRTVSPLIAVLGAAITTALLYGIFELIFKVNLPSGFLF